MDALLGKLADSSLITISLTSGVVTAHRLVMRVIREQLAGGRRLHRAARAAATLLQDLLVPNERAWERPGEVEDLVKHVTALHEHLPSQTWTTVPDRRLAEAELSLRAHVMWYLNDMMTLPDHAVAFGHSLAADCEQVLGASHPLTLHAQHHLAYAYETAGHLPEAIRRYERTADERIRVLGPEDPATFWVRRHLAYAYLTAGRVSDAAALCEQLAGEAERLWGPGHPATLSARHTLAAIYTSAGRCSEAIQIGENVLAARRKVLGPDHNDTFTTRNMLSRAYETAGDYERALTLYTRNLADRERVLGHNHADTLASRFNLARACRAAGRHDEADQHEQALAGCDAALGPDHPYARAVRQGIAVVLRDPDLTKNPEFNIRRRTRPLLMLATTARSAADRQPAGGGWWLHTSLPKVAETHPVLERHDLAGSSDKAAGVIRNLPVSTPPSASGWRPAACWRSRTSSRTALPSTSRP
ncbi:MAG: tetratricopeptide repeat protein [Streptosporangiaceae bacterium]|nr:tetratricopeptide repeat protein [Streptosporangiaceae bacterium]